LGQESQAMGEGAPHKGDMLWKMSLGGVEELKGRRLRQPKKRFNVIVNKLQRRLE